MSFNKRILSAGAADLVPSENFSIVTYTGTGSSNSITGVGFQPDFVWIKRRNATDLNVLTDSVRGTDKQLFSNQTDAESVASTRLTSFDTNGFTLSGSGTRVNDSGGTYVAWCWKANGGTTSSNGEGDITSTVQANTDAGFSIVSYTGNGTDDQTVGHGLTAKCDLVIIKDRSSADKWLVQLPQLGDTARMVLEGTAAKTDDDTTTQAGNTTVFGIGDDNSVNKSSDNFIAYCFHSVDGFSKIGSYTGNGDAYGPIVETGFEVGWLMIKNADDTESGGASWLMYDNKRNTTNPRDSRLWANSDAAEYSADCYDVDFLANGFQIAAFCSTYGMNESGDTYIYMAIAADPDTEAPTLADSFNIETYAGTSATHSISGLGFSPNFVWLKERDGTDSHQAYDTIRGANNVIYPNGTNAQYSGSEFPSFDSDGFTLSNNSSNNESSKNYVAWAWKANDDVPTINDNGSIDSIVSANANAGFSIVKWNGTGSNGTVGHGLSATPEIIISKNLTSAATDGWPVYSQTIGNDYTFFLNSSGAKASTGGTWGSTSPTSTVFTVQDNDSNNEDGDEIIAYCFHSVAGYSKISSYSGTGSSNAITGMGFQPDYVMIKEADGIDSWEVYDSVRGDDKVLYPNGSNAEGTGSNFTSFDSGGFTVSSATSVNESGKTYIYAAFKINLSAADAAGKMAFLVIAGGASGGRDDDRSGGGGGAGGLRTSYGSTSGGGGDNEGDIHLTAGTYTITVGDGGAAVSSSDGLGNDGGDSSIAATGLTTITSTGGGGGGQNIPGRDGGSGGGGAHGSQAGGSGTANQGFDGGQGIGESTYNGGGGGGASAAGSNSSASNGGNGGAGLAVSITGSSVTYAGGGGGGGGGTAGSGGSGGGGAGNTTTATAGTANTGSGGGGAQGTSGAGGSGVVILRLLTSEYSGSTTGSPTVTTSGSSTIIKFTASGTYVHS